MISNFKWPDGVYCILCLLRSTFGLTSVDGIAHLVEQVPAPALNAPKVITLAVRLGSISSSTFGRVIFFFSYTDTDTFLGTESLLQCYNRATRKRAGAKVLVIFNLSAMAFSTKGLLLTTDTLGPAQRHW